jgi:hypothetical protein
MAQVDFFIISKLAALFFSLAVFFLYVITFYTAVTQCVNVLAGAANTAISVNELSIFRDLLLSTAFGYLCEEASGALNCDLLEQFILSMGWGGLYFVMTAVFTIAVLTALPSSALGLLGNFV